MTFGSYTDLLAIIQLLLILLKKGEHFRMLHMCLKCILGLDI